MHHLSFVDAHHILLRMASILMGGCRLAVNDYALVNSLPL
ncbi:hypothetical protein VCRA2128O305_330040 [Vibrio crassostreae]|nr:hypothetical protein VCRA2133O312_390021 [Vibrio crassostreae]CAK3411811.1 hypothetical protein VCRA2121O261_380025 [Vibrio crassostreae]CAK3456568.1 hypothetical protein VCRA2125O290_390045 [Vibrio crassostreae]CAK3473271.1 hypothetical protein VCRA2128O309_600045 [Vibrio crassostreae]CAK3527378.1 hypothetical protein VCRA2122O268_370001 [Vibrio crassostreae]